ncbi:MAG: helix-turn-helix domain-containing protein, partial [Clostridia bacterium]|nr:helix-turn-helix domain-containing protein [Clostridia bacterium]
SMQGVMPLSLQALATACCLIDHDLNGGELYMQEALFDSTPAPTPAEEDAPQREVHNTMDIERTLVRYVREGDVDAILAWAKHAPHVNAGTTSAVYLRAERNILVVAATLMSRAAIEGGVPAQEALGLSDEYIRRSEATTSSGQLSYLQFRMVLDYAERVRRYRLSRASTLLSRRVVGYVLDHLEGPVKVEEIARELGVSRPYLSAQFARDTGKSLTDYILEQKVERARELLRSSEEPLSTVAERLGFSSQSHFCRVFKEQVGLTPARFRRGEEEGAQ